MRKSVIISVLSLAVLFTCSCGKEDTTPKTQCEQNSTGYLNVTNTSEDPYHVWVDGSYAFQVDGFSSKAKHEVSQGSHSVYMEQASGFIITPSAYEWSGTFAVCEEHTLEIP